MFIFILLAGFDHESDGTYCVATNEGDLKQPIANLLMRDYPFDNVRIERWTPGATKPSAVKTYVFNGKVESPIWRDL